MQDYFLRFFPLDEREEDLRARVLDPLREERETLPRELLRERETEGRELDRTRGEDLREIEDRDDDRGFTE